MWTFILKLLGGSIGPYIAGAVLAAFLGLTVALGVQTLRLRAAEGDSASYKAGLVSERQAFATEKARGDKSEAARLADHSDAVTDANSTTKTCEARVVKARTTTAAIDALLNKAPTHAPDPVEPELLTAGELRIATGR